MDVPTASTAVLQSTSASEPLSMVARWTAGAANGLLLLISLVFLTRRLSGALLPLAGVSLICTAAALACLAAVLRYVWQHFAASAADNQTNLLSAQVGAALPSGRSLRWGHRGSALDSVMILLPTAALLILGATLSMPGSPPIAMAVFWIVLIAEESAWLGMNFRSPRAASGPSRQLDQDVADAEDRSPLESIDTLEDGQLPEQATQQLTRALQDDGTDVLYGKLRGSFAPGQRSVRLHVAFCPPFDRRPKITLQQVFGTPVMISQGQVQPYGARLELRLPRMSPEAQSVVLDFRAQDEPLPETEPARPPTAGG